MSHLAKLSHHCDVFVCMQRRFVMTLGSAAMTLETVGNAFLGCLSKITAGPTANTSPPGPMSAQAMSA